MSRSTHVSVSLPFHWQIDRHPTPTSQSTITHFKTRTCTFSGLNGLLIRSSSAAVTVKNPPLNPNARNSRFSPDTLSGDSFPSIYTKSIQQHGMNQYTIPSLQHTQPLAESSHEESVAPLFSFSKWKQSASKKFEDLMPALVESTSCEICTEWHLLRLRMMSYIDQNGVWNSAAAERCPFKMGGCEWSDCWLSSGSPKEFRFGS